MTKTKNSILIPYTTETIDEESYFDERDTVIHTVYCYNDESQIFIKTTKKLSGNESEPLLCPFCKKSLHRHHGLSEFVLSTTTPEVIGCLELKNNKTLSLVVQKSCSDQEMGAIRAILDRHNFTKFALKINIFQHLKNFRQTLKPLNKKEFLSSKNLRKLFCVKLKQLKKPKLNEKKKQDAKAENINLADLNQKWTSERSLTLIKKQWTRCLNNAQKFSAKSKKGMKKKLFQMQNLNKEISNSKKLLGKSRSGETALEFFQSQMLAHLLKEDQYLSEKTESL